jgi:putative phosphoesterase
VTDLTPVDFAEATTLRVGLISDTHIPDARAQLWPEVFIALEGVDVILHGGDIHDLGVLDDLGTLAPVFAARGNGEDGSGGRAVAPQDARLRDAWVLDLAGVRVGLIHDLPVPESPPYRTVERWKARRLGADADVIVFGDTHVEVIQRSGHTLCVNPGSPTYPHNLETQLGTIGFLHIGPRVDGLDGALVRANIWQLAAGAVGALKPGPLAGDELVVPNNKERS